MRTIWYKHIFIVLWLLGALPMGMTAQTDILEAKQDDGSWVRSLTDSLTLLLQDEMFTTSQLGLCVYDLTADSAIFEHNARQRMRPASTEKLLTAITALTELGSDYRFLTRLYIDGEVKNGRLNGDIVVKGGFDPTFGNAGMKQLVAALSAQGIKSVSGVLCTDISMKDTDKWGLGWCWDDKNPVLTPLLYGGRDEFASRMKTALRKQGIVVNKVRQAVCPAEAVLLKTYSTPMTQVMKRMMKESDNLYAEALFYALAAKDGKPYATRKDAFYHIERLIGNLGFDPDRYSVADGSGLSLYNYLTAELETALLRYAYKHINIYEPLYASLPIAGVDGTLEKRMLETPAMNNVRAKTGTLTGVYSLAGYATASNGHKIAFCIINQGTESGRTAREFQDKVCVLLCR